MRKLKDNIRIIVQLAFAALTNGYAQGFVRGDIYKGNLKMACVPGLNCYSCPGALGSCPIGSLQATLNSGTYKIAFYVVGFFMVVGALLGRVVCGWLCPFGLVQDLLYKIPFVRKLKNLPGDRALRWLKYGVLLVLVILLPMFVMDATGQGKPWFCEYVCPSGTLTAGLPLVLLNKGLRGILGWLYVWKVAVLAAVVILSVIVYRPFCKYVCPLGAVYGAFNKISFVGYAVDMDKCTRCGHCGDVCKMDVKLFENPGSAECIRCGDCRKACPAGAISLRNFGGRPAPSGTAARETREE